MAADLCPRNAVKADTHHHPADRNLVISELDPVQVKNRQRIGCDETVQSEDFVHLYGCNEGATSLTYNGSNCGPINKGSGVNQRPMTHTSRNI